jgi:hypothetical protein
MFLDRLVDGQQLAISGTKSALIFSADVTLNVTLIYKYRNFEHFQGIH